jgi:pyridoxine 5-phosphate synthase
MDMVLQIKPTQVTLVPDGIDAITSNAGWDTIKHQYFLSEVISEFKRNGIRTSIFVDPSLDRVEGAFAVGADRIELYTEDFAKAYSSGNRNTIIPYAACAERANQLGLGVNAGHDLSLENIEFFAKNIPHLAEVSIGHALISEALYKGLQPTIAAYLSKLA